MSKYLPIFASVTVHRGTECRCRRLRHGCSCDVLFENPTSLAASALRLGAHVARRGTAAARQDWPTGDKLEDRVPGDTLALRTGVVSQAMRAPALISNEKRDGGVLSTCLATQDMICANKLCVIKHPYLPLLLTLVLWQQTAWARLAVAAF